MCAFRLTLAVLTSGLTGFSVFPAHATPMLQLEATGVAAVTITDNGIGDISPLQGAVTFNGALGDFILNVTTGLSKPLLGTPAFPHLDLNSVNVNSFSGGTLTIRLTDTGFIGNLPTVNFASLIGGTTFGNVSYSTYIAQGNNPFATDTLISNMGPYGSGSFSGGQSNTISLPSGPYTLTLVAQITHSGAFQSTSFDAVLKVPEPSSMFLFVAGIIGFGMVCFARRRGYASLIR